MLHSKGLVLALPSSFRLVLKWLKVTNTLAYYRTKLMPPVNILWCRLLGNARLHSTGRLLALDASISTMVKVTESKHWRFEIGWTLDICFPIWSELIPDNDDPIPRQWSTGKSLLGTRSSWCFLSPYDTGQYQMIPTIPGQTLLYSTNILNYIDT
jgi:hypothetical protein